MDAGDSGAFMEDFGDSLNDEDDPGQTKSGRNVMEGLDTSLQAPNANDFSNARLIEEVRIRMGAERGRSRRNVVFGLRVLHASTPNAPIRHTTKYLPGSLPCRLACVRRSLAVLVSSEARSVKV